MWYDPILMGPSEILAAALDEYRDTHEEAYAEPSNDSEVVRDEALGVVASHALELLDTRLSPGELGASLSRYMAGVTDRRKVEDLFKHSYVVRRAEIAACENAVDRLRHLEKRVLLAYVAFLLLGKAKPSRTATKYMQRLVDLYLAGFGTEVFIMCGAVLESALEHRLPDDELRRMQIDPAFSRRSGKAAQFSFGNRMLGAKKLRLFTKAQQEEIWQIANWRNDAVHVQPDLAPVEPADALLAVARLLPVILPPDDPGVLGHVT